MMSNDTNPQAIRPYESANPTYESKHSTIEVLGEGSVMAVPDQAVITLGVITESKELREAQADNSAAVTRIIQALRQMGVPQERIQTIEYRIESHYDYIDGKQIFRGYQVTHLLQITTDNIGQAGAIVDAAVAAGANTVRDIRFTLSQPAIYENKALALAVQNAASKAHTIARMIGIAISPVPTRVQELVRGGQPPIAFADMAVKASAATPLQPGQLTITASVRAWFQRR